MHGGLPIAGSRNSSYRKDKTSSQSLDEARVLCIEANELLRKAQQNLRESSLSKQKLLDEMNKKLLRAFKRSKMSNYRLSQESGVSESTIGRWVRDELPRGLQLETVEKITAALGLKFDLIECD